PGGTWRRSAHLRTAAGVSGHTPRSAGPHLRARSAGVERGRQTAGEARRCSDVGGPVGGGPFTGGGTGGHRRVRAARGTGRGRHGAVVARAVDSRTVAARAVDLRVCG